MTSSTSSTSNLFIVGLAVAIVYFLFKFLEMRFINPDESKPLKLMVRDTLMVYISSVIGVFVLTQSSVADAIGEVVDATPKFVHAPAFIDNPGF